MAGSDVPVAGGDHRADRLCGLVLHRERPLLGDAKLLHQRRDERAAALAYETPQKISASLQEKLPYDSTKDLKAVTLVAKVPEMHWVAWVMRPAKS